MIGVDLDSRKPRALDFDEVPGTWALLRDRLRPRKPRRYHLPTLAAYLMNVTILYSMSRQRQAQRLTDLYFNPPLDRVGLLEWKRFDDIVQQGYAHAVEALRPAATSPMKRAARRRPTVRCEPAGGLLAVRGLAVRGDVQAFALLFFGDAQADRQVDDLVGDERDHAGPDHRHSHRLGLDPELVADRRSSRPSP